MTPSEMIALRRAAKALMAVTLSTVLTVGLAVPAAAETSNVRIMIQNGLQYLPFAIMKHEGLIEKEAAKAGIKDLTVTIQQVIGGNVLNDAIISGNTDIAATGTAFTILWAQTKGTLDVKGMAAYNELSHKLITLNPKIKTIADFTQDDRIALPTVRISTQALLLEMESEKLWGLGHYNKLDALTVSRPHPEAVAALLSGRSEITAHFSGPPYQGRELKAPGAHVVLTGAQVLGASPTGIVLTTSAFRNANPKVYRAVLAGLDQAMKRIKADPRGSAEIYKAVFKDKEAVEDLMAMMQEPGFDYDLAPKGQLKIAQFMYRTGAIKVQPQSWKDMFFPEIYDLPGN